MKTNSGCFKMRMMMTAVGCAMVIYLTQGASALPEMGIRCLPQASTGTGKVLLRDIAVINGALDQLMREQVEALEIAAAPEPGNSRMIKVDYIKIRLRQEGFDPEQFNFSGAQEIYVTAAAQKINGAELMATAEQYVRARLPWPAEEVQITAERMPPEVTIGPGKYSLDVKNCAANDWLGKIFMQMCIQTESAMQVVPLTLSVRRFGTVLVAKNRIEKGQPLAENDVEVRREEIKDTGAALQDAAQLRGRRARAPIVAGQTIQERMLEKIPLVSRRQLMNALLETENLRIVLKVQALENGCAGDIIRVQNIDSKKELPAEVVSDNLVRIVR